MQVIKFLLFILFVSLCTIILKYFFLYLDINVLETSSLVGPLISASIFCLGVALNSAFQEYKEVYKFPGELANHLESLFEDLKHLPKEDARLEAKNNFGNILLSFSEKMNLWSERKVRSREIFEEIDRLSEFVYKSESILPPNYIVRMRNEIFNIRRIFIRFDVARDTQMSREIELISMIFSLATITTIMLTRFETDATGLWAVGIVTLFFASIQTMIHILDNPTHYGLIDFKSLLKLSKKI